MFSLYVYICIDGIQPLNAMSINNISISICSVLFLFYTLVLTTTFSTEIVANNRIQDTPTKDKLIPPS